MRGGQRDRGACEVEACGDPMARAGGGAQAVQGVGQGGAFQGGRGEGSDEAAGFSEIVHRGLPGRLHMAGGGIGAVGQDAFGGAQQQLDAGQALGEGVVDLAGQAFTFGQYPGSVLDFGQVGARGGELLDQAPALFTLPVKGLVAPHHRDRDGGAERGSDRHGRAEGALVGGEAGAGRRRGGNHSGKRGAARQQVELKEVQRERHPYGVGGQGQQHQPHDAHSRQPQRGGPPGSADAGHDWPDRVHRSAQHCGGDRQAGMRLAVSCGPRGGQGEQADDQQVQAPGQGPSRRGQDGGSGVHSAFQATKACCSGASIESWNPRAAFRPAKWRPAPDAHTGPAATVSAYRFHRRKGQARLCSSPGEISSSPRGASP